MSQKLKVELQDENGNIYYLHTAADVVYLDDGTTVEAALEAKVAKSGGDIANTVVSAIDTSTASFPVLEANDKPRTSLGKINKWFSDCLAKFANYVLTSAITNQYLNDTSKIPTAALMYLLKQEVNGLNSEVVKYVTTASDFPDLTSLIEFYSTWNKPYMFGLDWTSSLSPDGSTTVGIGVRGIIWGFTLDGGIYFASGDNPQWTEIVKPQQST